MRYGSFARVFLRGIGVLAGILALFAGSAQAGKVDILNCTGSTVRLCAFDGSDVVMSIAASQGDLKAGEAVRMKCNNTTGCKVKVSVIGVNCVSASNEDNLMGAKSLGQNSYRLLKNGGSYSFENVSDSVGHFDNPANKKCAVARIGQSCSKQEDCYEGSCNKNVNGASICCKTDCSKATCQACSENGQQCDQAPYGKPGQYCDQSWQMCDGSKCVHKSSVQNGKSCVGALECKSGFCADGVCCDGACDGACASCNQAGKAGMCSPLAEGQQRLGRCDGLRACDKDGKCRSKAGPCKADSDCLSNRCMGVTPCPLGAGRCGKACAK